MSFYRVYPSKDVWITNQYMPNSTTDIATGSNHGASPSLNVFAGKGITLSGSVEIARTLIKFDLTELSGKIYTDKVIPSSSLSYILKMFDKKHDNTVPTSYDLVVYPLSCSWDEGSGSDDSGFRDDGYCNWASASSTTAWVTTGSDFLHTGYGSASQHFDQGYEDLEVDVTNTVNYWLTGTMPNTISNNGFVVMLSSSQEDSPISYYRKIFHGRETQFVDKIPYLEARWNSVKKDNRKNFGLGVDNNLFLYNFVRGTLTSFNEPVTLRIQDNIMSVSASYSHSFTTFQYETGILSATINLSLTSSFSSSVFYEIWASGSRVYYSGTFEVSSLTSSNIDPYSQFVADVTNLKREYMVDEEARLNVSVRKRDFKTHVKPIHTASSDIEREYIEQMFYSITNDDTGEMIVPFGTGSLTHTQLSYDGNGNYFNLWMNSFVPGFKYRIKFLVYTNRYQKSILDDNYTFKVI